MNLTHPARDAHALACGRRRRAVLRHGPCDDHAGRIPLPDRRNGQPRAGGEDLDQPIIRDLEWRTLAGGVPRHPRAPTSVAVRISGRLVYARAAPPRDAGAPAASRHAAYHRQGAAALEGTPTAFLVDGGRRGASLCWQPAALRAPRQLNRREDAERVLAPSHVCFENETTCVKSQHRRLAEDDCRLRVTDTPQQKGSNQQCENKAEVLSKIGSSEQEQR